MPNTRPAEGDTSTHTLFFGEAPKRPPQDTPRTDEGRKTEGRQAAPEGGQHRGKPKVQMPESDDVPF